MADGVELVLRAAAFAGAAHGRQKRKASDDPYINHPLRVAHAAARCGLPPEAIAAALLHDVVEDTPISLQGIQAAFPSRVAELVHLLTQWWPDDAPADVKQREKPKYYEALLQDPDAIAIKLLDRADNLHDMVRMLPRARGWAKRYLKKTEAELAPVVAASQNPQARLDYETSLRALRNALKTP